MSTIDNFFPHTLAMTHAAARFNNGRKLQFNASRCMNIENDAVLRAFFFDHPGMAMWNFFDIIPKKR